jgi:hypothetical protein
MVSKRIWSRSSRFACAENTAINITSNLHGRPSGTSALKLLRRIRNDLTKGFRVFLRSRAPERHPAVPLLLIS